MYVTESHNDIFVVCHPMHFTHMYDPPPIHHTTLSPLENSPSVGVRNTQTKETSAGVFIFLIVQNRSQLCRVVPVVSEQNR